MQANSAGLDPAPFHPYSLNRGLRLIYHHRKTRTTGSDLKQIQRQKEREKKKKKRGKRSNDERFMCHILRLNTPRFGTFGEGEIETQITSSMEDNISQIRSQVRDKVSLSIPVVECTLI